MKKKLVTLKSLGQAVLAVMMILVLIGANVDVKTENVLIIETLPTEYLSEEERADTLLNKEMHQYSLFHDITIVYYADRTDTLITPPGRKKVLHDVVLYRHFWKAVDSWMAQDPREKVFMNGWISFSAQVPDDTEHTLCLRKLDEFKGERVMVVAAPVRNRTEVYFEMMQDLSDNVDECINQQFKRSITFSITRKVWESRVGKPKLRPFLTYLAYRCCGGKGFPIELFALQEVQSLSLYTDNWIIDNKKQEIPRSELVIASAQLRRMQEMLLLRMKLSSGDRIKLRATLDYSNDLSYRGQMHEVKDLSIESVVQYDWDKDETAFFRAYRTRCRLLNMPYAFSLWAGGFVAGASKRELFWLWEAGLQLGEGLQMINDWYDTHPENPNQFADLSTGRITLPYYLELVGKSPTEIKEYLERWIKWDGKEALGAMYQLPDNEWRRLLENATHTLFSNRIMK